MERSSLMVYSGKLHEYGTFALPCTLFETLRPVSHQTVAKVQTWCHESVGVFAAGAKAELRVSEQVQQHNDQLNDFNLFGSTVDAVFCMQFKSSLISPQPHWRYE
eukprot:1177514-Prorocentrum_minimum.AAC.4